MKLISDKDGVDIIISPVTGNDGIEVNLDFNFAIQKLHDLDTLHKDWVLKLIDKGGVDWLRRLLCIPVSCRRSRTENHRPS